MKKYHIYHPKHGEMNHECANGVYEYELVASVEAKSMHHAFAMAQNDFSELYERLSLRSTSVGDLIHEDGTEHPCIIEGMDFKPVPFNMVDKYVSQDYEDYYEESKHGEYIDFEMV